MSRSDVAFYQNGLPVTFAEATTEDLRISAIRYRCRDAQEELARRGINVHVIVLQVRP